MQVKFLKSTLVSSVQRLAMDSVDVSEGLFFIYLACMGLLQTCSSEFFLRFAKLKPDLFHHHVHAIMNGHGLLLVLVFLPQFILRVGVELRVSLADGIELQVSDRMCTSWNAVDSRFISV